MRFKLKPGSLEAIVEGCTCDEALNHFGAGYRLQPGVYALDPVCPIHDTKRPAEAIDLPDQHRFDVVPQTA